MKCSWCCKPLNPKESENPRRDKHNDVMCDECYHDEYEFTCCLCQNYEHTDYQHVLLVVADNRDLGYNNDGSLLYPLGIYRIVDFPYFMDAMIGMGWFIEGSIEWIAPLPEGIDTDCYPCGHLCQSCQTKVLSEAKVNA